MRIVVVEDNKLYRDELLQCLEQEESDIEIIGSAANGARGLALVEKLVREKAGPDVIFTDIRMPEMDGLSAASRIRALDRPDARAVPILAMTADAFGADVQRALAAGMNDHLAKPIEPAQLYRALACQLRRTA